MLRGLKSDLKYRQIDKADELTDDYVIAVLSSSAKKIEGQADGKLVDKLTMEMLAKEV